MKFDEDLYFILRHDLNKLLSKAELNPRVRSKGLEKLAPSGLKPDPDLTLPHIAYDRLIQVYSAQGNGIAEKARSFE